LPLPKSPVEAGQALPQGGGTLSIYIFALPPSLLGEGGEGDEVINIGKLIVTGVIYYF